MFKLTALAAIVALLSACSGMGTTTSSNGMSRSTMGASGANNNGNGMIDAYRSGGAGGPN